MRWPTLSATSWEISAAAHWFIPTESEWYKAAYYDPKKSGGAGYWLYPAKSDDVPEANLSTNAPSEAGKV
jgi:hypothetical protein